MANKNPTEGDQEARALGVAIEHKNLAIAALELAAAARRLRGHEDLGVLESVDLERMMRDGYQRALDRRNRELVELAGKAAR